MTNQQHLFLALSNTAIAIANNAVLKKYRNTCIFVLGCDGFLGSAAVFAGDPKHLEKHVFQAMCQAPELAVAFNKAYERAMQEPEIAEKVRKIQNADVADDIIRGVFNGDEE